jgi:hypothetical protein
LRFPSRQNHGHQRQQSADEQQKPPVRKLRIMSSGVMVQDAQEFVHAVCNLHDLSDSDETRETNLLAPSGDIPLSSRILPKSQEGAPLSGGISPELEYGEADLEECP